MKPSQKKEARLSQEYLCGRFSYNPITGSLLRKDRKGKVGWSDRYGYQLIEIKGQSYMIHRLIWFIQYGGWPEEIDHINGVRWDNRLENLRDVSHKENGKNQKLYKSNKSGYAGVHWCKTKKKWIAMIHNNAKQITLGHFDDKALAISTRIKAEKKYSYHQNHGVAR